jgi:tRNA-Thr(GGU) m(6)t(6)A37 methyltransferase TsaA
MEFIAIGSVENGIHDIHKHDWDQVESKIVLKSKYKGGLKGLEEFSHAEILFFLDQASFDIESELLGKPRRNREKPIVGIFSRRSNHRPNGIGLTVAKILEVGDEYLLVQGLDAVHGTILLDIKPYVPKVEESKVKRPDWAR